MTTKQETKDSQSQRRIVHYGAPVGKLGRAFAEVSPVSLGTRTALTKAGYLLSRTCALPSTILAARRRLQYTLWLGEASE